jgi:hypothetical protein|tara:strand:+ start:317 stop:553 length:237 start_codon:yes stop_codon:yes gene_type:complete
MNKKKKDFFQELRDRNVWREVRAYLLSGAAGIPFLIGLHTLYPNILPLNAVTIVCIIFFTLSNMAKATAQKWNIEILN